MKREAVNPGKEEAIDPVKEADTVITLKAPRFARSTKQLCEIIEVVKEKRLKLVIVGSITVDCTGGRLDPMSNAFIQMSGVFAELELGMIRERVKSGMANAKAKGVRIGRPELTKDDNQVKRVRKLACERGNADCSTSVSALLKHST